MPLFGRKKEQTEEEPFVQTDTGWRPLQEAVNTNWLGLAATAWIGFQREGRGAVWADFAAYDFRFASVDVLRDIPEWPGVLQLANQYNPKREVVLVTTVTRGRGDAIHLSDLVTLLHTPRGVKSPPEAAVFMQRAEETHQVYTRMQTMKRDLDEEWRREALDPDTV